MTTHQLRADQFSAYMDFNYFRSEYRMRVAGARGGDFQLSFVPTHGETRDYQNGPMTPGPKLHGIGLGVCITSTPHNSGTAFEVSEAKRQHRFIEAEVGDLFVIDGCTFELTLTRDKHNVEFRHLANCSHSRRY